MDCTTPSSQKSCSLKLFHLGTKSASTINNLNSETDSDFKVKVSKKDQDYYVVLYKNYKAYFLVWNSQGVTDLTEFPASGYFRNFQLY